VRDAIGDGYEVRRTEVVAHAFPANLSNPARSRCHFDHRVLCYLWFRFEWQFAVGAIIATMHDLLLTVGFFALTRLEFNTTSIAPFSPSSAIPERNRRGARPHSRDDAKISQDADRPIDRCFGQCGDPRTIMTATTVFLALISLVVFGVK